MTRITFSFLVFLFILSISHVTSIRIKIDEINRHMRLLDELHSSQKKNDAYQKLDEYPYYDDSDQSRNHGHVNASWRNDSEDSVNEEIPEMWNEDSLKTRADNIMKEREILPPSSISDDDSSDESNREDIMDMAISNKKQVIKEEKMSESDKEEQKRDSTDEYMNFDEKEGAKHDNYPGIILNMIEDYENDKDDDNDSDYYQDEYL